ncbi:MAG: helix-turn-helix transcriptional regulator [Saprospiraceae bacterium]|nr:helix-turn-helix transcriptional regulator [Saprospiraceae bacterium]
MLVQKRKSDCPINFALEIFGDRWTLLIIRDLMFKEKNYYGEFLVMEEKIATNILADRLALLESCGIVTRTIDEQHNSKKIYKLSKKGIDLLPVLTEIILWSAKYDQNSAVDKKFVRQIKKNREKMFGEITNHLLERKAKGE